MEKLIIGIVSFLVHNKRVILILTGLFIILPLFAYGKSAESILSWLYGYLFIILTLRCLLRGDDKNTKIYFQNVALVSYAILSIAGSVMAFDNLRNFDEVFASHHDDSFYFCTIKSISEIESISDLSQIETEEWFFEYSFAIIAFIIRICKFGIDIKPLDLLPFVWAFGALTITLIARFILIIVRIKPPYWILFVSLLGNYVFLRNSILLYRESFNLFFVFLAFVHISQNHLLKGGVFTALSFLNRGLNSLFIITFGVLNFLTTKVFGKKWGILYVFFIFISPIIFYLGKPVIEQNYARLLSLSAPYHASETVYNRWKDIDISKFMERRAYDSSTRSTGAQIAVKMGGPYKYLIDSIMYVFFPVAFHPIVYDVNHKSVYQSLEVSDGIFFFSIIEWGNVISWFIVIPLVLLGMWNALKSLGVCRNVFILYILGLIVFVIFRGHQRYFLPFIAFHALFGTIGYMKYFLEGRMKPYKILQYCVIIAVLSYNVIKYMVL